MRDRDLYEQNRGADALDRQVAEAENRFVCCGELRVRGHHRQCRNYEEPIEAEHVDGQQDLFSS